jgi:hypothetical protein
VAVRAASEQPKHPALFVSDAAFSHCYRKKLDASRHRTRGLRPSASRSASPQLRRGSFDHRRPCDGAAGFARMVERAAVCRRPGDDHHHVADRMPQPGQNTSSQGVPAVRRQGRVDRGAGDRAMAEPPLGDASEGAGERPSARAVERRTRRAGNQCCGLGTVLKIFRGGRSFLLIVLFVPSCRAC